MFGEDWLPLCALCSLGVQGRDGGGNNPTCPFVFQDASSSP